ncbi:MULTISPECIES: aminoglycoside phosphotransferase family protein [Streptomyces]|uniref:Aminoglycoside phosphotransferase (APT) family kinase protein n=1 Tax=Streptomyces stelliscabiei TaxID=146820 RepID=A0A8I0TNK5_9ACTN|nr:MULTISPECIES: aminoglycoside phosphotransferase family protein [Streptomyces]KND40506.1 aminoglycoside phosphotransferase [Streptomyces stelliscabiei]MBE1594634.1 aminoglycoside phosphotransferase (APT) family kinase protein [Streptomyces stelliscabiei]MDX2521111.1 aminoglycoside phosphotransferase family protein [Streptomyces stelliscabiei]SOD82640.1 Predicted kinase, aminoglycoside phosphotransferase (APT) family [Streptomyces sp. 1222.2]
MTVTELDITEDLIRELLREQFPDLADLPLKLGARGWDNQVWRLGDDLAVRLPWATESADALLYKEHMWLPVLAPRLPLPTPVPQHLGEPSERFPRPWLVTTWVPGDPADHAPATRTEEAAVTLAHFLTALHRPAPDGAPTGRDRGGSLADTADRLTQGLTSATELGLIRDPEAVRAVWEDAAAAPEWTGPRLWLHGDLHPANIVTRNGTFCGVIDFGDLFAGDPACDLSGAWSLLPDGAVDLFHETYQPNPDPATLRRARGWAVLRALGGIHIGHAGLHGRPGGKATWGPPAHAALRRLTASA